MNTTYVVTRTIFKNSSDDDETVVYRGSSQDAAVSYIINTLKKYNGFIIIKDTIGVEDESEEDDDIKYVVLRTANNKWIRFEVIPADEWDDD